MKRVLINLGGWLVLPFLFLWLLCCTGCVTRDMEGNTYAFLPFTDDEGDFYQVQLNHPTHYRIKGEADWK